MSYRTLLTISHSRAVFRYIECLALTFDGENHSSVAASPLHRRLEKRNSNTLLNALMFPKKHGRVHFRARAYLP